MFQEETKAQRWRRKIRYAVHLRQHMTEAETILWDALRNRKLDNLKFRRQAPISWFIADFLCMQHHLIIEVDGPIHHDQQVYDKERDQELQSLGYKIIRFTNNEIITDLSSVLEQIKQTVSPLSR